MKPILQQADLFRCPLCHGQLTAGETSLRCERGHDFALSKKGYVDFCPAAKAGPMTTPFSTAGAGSSPEGSTGS